MAKSATAGALALVWSLAVGTAFLYLLTMQQIRHFAALTLLGLVVIVSVQNVETVDLRFLVWTFSAPRVILLFSLFCVGAIVGWLAHGKRATK